MNGGQAGWLFLLLFALMLILIGAQGSLGQFVGILFCPSQVNITQE